MATAKREEPAALARVSGAYRALCDSGSVRELQRGGQEVIDRVVDEYFADEFVTHSPHPGVTHDLAGTKEWTAVVIKAFPDYNVTIDDEFASGDKVATRWTARGTHRGEFLGIPPTGKELAVPGITISQYAKGKIVESWSHWDTAALMRQLGAYPSEEGKWETTGGITLNFYFNRK